jgi:hypothetical protein
MSDNWKTKAAFAAIGVLTLARIVFAFVPEGRFWGVNQLAYFPPAIAIVFMTAMLLASVCCFNSRLVQVFIDLHCFIANKLRLKSVIIKWFIATAILMGIFIIFRDTTNLLGDGLLRIGELQNKRIDDFLSLHSAEPLDYLIHYYFYTVLSVFFKIKPILSYQILSAMAGVLFIFGARYFSGQLPKGAMEFGFWYLIGWGGLMLFFGYVESYALAAAALIFLFGYSQKYILKTGNDLILAGLFLLSFFLHNTAIVFLPAIIYLLLINPSKRKGRGVASIIILTAVVAVWIVVGIYSRQASGLLLTASSSEPGYTLFSLTHLGDIINQLLLISPTLLILIWLQNKRGIGNSNRMTNFYRLAATGGLAFLVMADPVLGMGRDWDLFSLPLLGFHIALLTGVEWTVVDSRLKAAILVILLFSTGLWIGVNHSAKASVERYKNIAGLDTTRSRYAYERLGTYLLLNQKWPEAEEVYQLSLRREPHYRTYLGLAYIQAQMGKADSAQINYERALELKPEQAMALYSLCQMYIKEGRLIQARDLFERLKRVSATGIVNISEKGIKELEAALLKAETGAGDQTDTVEIR